MALGILFYLLLAVELIVVGWIDLKTKKISNWWSLLNIVVAVTLCLIGSIGPIFSFLYLKFPAIIFLTGFVLYWVKVMGAGDVKFLTTLLLMLSIKNQEIFIDGLLYATVIVGLILITINAIKHFKFIISCILLRTFHGAGKLFGKKFSYAPVILLAWIYFGWMHSR